MDENRLGRNGLLIPVYNVIIYSGKHKENGNILRKCGRSHAVGTMLFEWIYGGFRKQSTGAFPGE